MHKFRELSPITQIVWRKKVVKHAFYGVTLDFNARVQYIWTARV
ncbi:hypothetical protein HMPREF0670_01235 [Prevotella sp. oral taxon 317 str. F0108]|nr:hypothetical protein HMPREF0670_01235 [Prevotella sp. oral taxon 317 str. F0108]